MTRRGVAFELQTPEPLTDARACSSLLPTPTVNDMGEGKTVEWWEAKMVEWKEKHGNGNGHGKSLSIEAMRIAVTLLPTPTARDHKDVGDLSRVPENSLLPRVIYRIARK